MSAQPGYRGIHDSPSRVMMLDLGIQVVHFGSFCAGPAYPWKLLHAAKAKGNWPS